MTTIYEPARPVTEREQLEQALERLVDAVLRDGDQDAALLHLADAIAHGLADARLEAEVWAAREYLHLTAGAADPDDEEDPMPDEDRDVDLADEDQLEDTSGHPT